MYQSVMDTVFKTKVILFMFGWGIINVQSQSVTNDLPEQINSHTTYVFYLHGGIIQEQGIHAVSEYYGPYEYLQILDTLASFGYHVISEARPKGTVEEEYALKVANQVNILLNQGVPESNIIIIGASLGGYITIEVASLLENKVMNYVVIGLCSDYAIGYFEPYKDQLCGNFLSIYEKTDEKQSCTRILENPACKSGFMEVTTNMGIGHGFLYKPYPEWVVPLVKWIENR